MTVGCRITSWIQNYLHFSLVLCFLCWNSPGLLQSCQICVQPSKNLSSGWVTNFVLAYLHQSEHNNWAAQTTRHNCIYSVLSTLSMSALGMTLAGVSGVCGPSQMLQEVQLVSIERYFMYPNGLNFFGPKEQFTKKGRQSLDTRSWNFLCNTDKRRLYHLWILFQDCRNVSRCRIVLLVAAEKAMPAACFLQDMMQPEAMELDTFGNVKQGMFFVLYAYLCSYE